MKNVRRRAKPSPKPDSIAEAVRYLARGDRSEGQIEQYLTGRAFAPPDVRKALRHLRRLGYVDDDAAALRLAQARLARRPMSREALVAELERRRFSAETVARAVRCAYTGLSEEALAERFLRSLPRRFTDAARESRRRAALLRGRGFPEDISEAVLASCLDHPER